MLDLLQCVIGPAKSGKTEWILNKIAQKAKNTAEQPILIVPEQFSFMCEKMLLQRLGAQIANRVKVYSFTKLCNEIGKEVGGLAGTPVDDGMRLLLAGKALKSLKGELKVFTKFYDSSDFARHVVDTIQEFKQCGITTENLRLATKNATNQGFRYKIEDLCLITDTYNALLQGIFIDPLDQIEQMCQKLNGISFFKGKTIFFDAFKDFTAPQTRIIERMICEAEECYFSFACVEDIRVENKMQITPFSSAQEGVLQLYALANKNGVKIAPAIHLKNSYFETPDMARLERVLSGEPNTTIQPAEHVFVRALPDMYAEIDFVFSEICRLVREENARYRDFAIVCRDAGQYDSAIENYAKSYGVPVYFDKRIDIGRLPLFMLVKGAMRSAVHFSTDDIFMYLKSGLTDLSADEINALENYCFIWGIDHKDWLRQWDMHPNGYDNAQEDATQELEKLNDLRLRVISPLRNLSVAGQTSACEYGKYIYNLLVKIGVADRLKKLAQSLEQIGALEEASCQYASWDTLMDIMDKLDVCLDDEEILPDKYLEYFSLACKEVTIGSLPEGLDDVTYGAADRIRTWQTKTVFLIGVNQGVFPRINTDSGLLGVYERTQLLNCGVDIKNTIYTKAMDEKYWFYHAVCLASKRAYVLYALSDLSGSPKEPSEIIGCILSAFDGCKKTFSNQDMGFKTEFLQALQPSFEKLAASWNENNGQISAGKQYFASLDEYSVKMQAICSQIEGNSSYISASNAKKLFGKDIYMSATRLDTYCKCAFSYFCRYGLKANRLKKAEMDVLLRGTLIHYIFEQILSRSGKDVCKMTYDEILQSCRCAALQYLSEVNIDIESQSSRFKYMVRQLVELSADLLQSVQKEFKNSDFVPTAFELKIGGEEIDALNVPLNEGQLYVFGSIDRVDTATVNDKGYVRVMDYKTGTKKFALHDTLYGLNLQMLIYLYAVIKNGNGKFGQYPAGILYKSLKREYTDQNKKATPGKMSGILCDDADVLLAMDKAANGETIPAKFNSKGGLHYSSSVMSQDDFQSVFAHIDHILQNAGNQLHSGYIAVDPLDSATEEACKYCDYKTVCRKENAHGNRKTKGYSISQTIEQMRGDENGI